MVVDESVVCCPAHTSQSSTNFILDCQLEHCNIAHLNYQVIIQLSPTRMYLYLSPTYNKYECQLFNVETNNLNLKGGTWQIYMCRLTPCCFRHLCLCVKYSIIFLTMQNHITLTILKCSNFLWMNHCILYPTLLSK